MKDAAFAFSMLLISMIVGAGIGLVAKTANAETGGLAADGCHKHSHEVFRHYPGTKKHHGICIDVDGETVKIPNEVVDKILSTVEPETVEIYLDPSPELVQMRDEAVAAAEAADDRAATAVRNMDFALSEKRAAVADRNEAIKDRDEAIAERDMYGAKLAAVESGAPVCQYERRLVAEKMGTWGSKLERAAQSLLDCLEIGE